MASQSHERHGNVRARLDILPGDLGPWPRWCTCQHQGVERDGECERGPRQECRAGQETDQHGPLPTPQLDEAGERQDRRDQVARVPDAAARRHPQDLGREAEQDRQPDPIAPADRPDPAEQPPAHADAGAGEEGVDPGFPLVGRDRPDERDQRHQRDGRERRERHIEMAVDGDDVVRAEDDVQPRSTVEERVGEVEEVATAGVELAVRQPVDEGRHRGQGETQQGLAIDPSRHAASSCVWARMPTTKTARSVSQKTRGYTNAGVIETSGTAVARGKASCPPATSGQEVRDRQEQQHRVMVPKDRREELTGDQRDQVGGLGRRPARRRHDRDQDEDRAEQLDEPGGVGAQAELIGDRARREVVRGRDRVADLSDEGDEVGPCSDPGEQRRRNGEDREGDDAHRDGAIASGQERPDEDEPRLELDRGTKGAAQAQAEGVVQPSPADREAQEQERPHLAELHGIRKWPGQTGQQDGPPADGRRDRHERDADEERGDRAGRSRPRPRSLPRGARTAGSAG